MIRTVFFVKPIHKYRTIVCKSKYNEKAIFDREPFCGEVTMGDAEDAFDACSSLKGTSRQQCYLSFGVDGDKVEKYLFFIKKMNNLLEKESIHSEEVENKTSKKEITYTNSIWDMIRVNFLTMHPLLTVCYILLAIICEPRKEK